ncbi:MAG: autotransporter-associated beta strand repeat-containing protein [Planctomycetaceae bacterium]|nr:autotransporter-associated beta strand repeat-containing protein [Planctomycetaceae bacterium]
MFLDKMHNCGNFSAGAASVADVSGAFGLNSAVTLANTAGVVLDLNGYDTQIGSLAGGGTTGGNVTLGTGTLTLGGADKSGSYAGTISGAGGLTKIGGGTETFTGVNSYAGATTISAGTLNFATTASLYGGNTADWTADHILVGSGGTLALRVGGAGEFTAADVTTLLTNLGGLGGAVNNNGLQAGSSIGFDTTNAGGSFTVADDIADSTGTGGGAIGVTKLGSGTLFLTGVNTYTGATNISGGVINIQSAAALGGPAGGVTVSSGAALEIQGGITVGNEALSLAGTGIGSGGALHNISGNNEWQGAITLTGATRINSDADTLTLSNANAITAANLNLTLGGSGDGLVTGAVDIGTGWLTKDGSGTWTLSGVNTYGGLSIISGSLVTGDSGPLGDVTLTGGSLDLATLSRSAGAVSIVAAAADGGDTIFNGSLTGTSYSASNADGNAIVSARLLANGAAGLTKTGAGTLTLAGANTYTGPTIISAGSVVMSGSGTLGGGTANLTLSGGSLDLGTLSETVGAVSITAPAAAGGDTIYNGSLAGSSYAVSNTTGNVTLSANLLANGAGGLAKTGAGTLTLSGDNTYAGATTVTAGVLNIQSDTALGTTAAGTTVSANAALQI